MIRPVLLTVAFTPWSAFSHCVLLSLSFSRSCLLSRVPSLHAAGFPPLAALFYSMDGSDNLRTAMAFMTKWLLLLWARVGRNGLADGLDGTVRDRIKPDGSHG